MGLMIKNCHYCMVVRADTRDHVVPRVMVKALKLRDSHWFHELNVVPACYACNQAKGDKPGDCECDTCLDAWHFYEVLKASADEPRPLNWISQDVLRDPLVSNISDLVDPELVARLLGGLPET